MEKFREHRVVIGSRVAATTASAADDLTELADRPQLGPPKAYLEDIEDGSAQYPTGGPMTRSGRKRSRRETSTARRTRSPRRRSTSATTTTCSGTRAIT